MKKIKIGNTNTVRDFTYVKDTVVAFEKALNDDVKSFGEVINIGSGKGVKIYEILRKVIKLWYKSKIKIDKKD